MTDRGRELRTIGKFCPGLKELELDPIDFKLTLVRFGQLYGHRLVRIKLQDCYDTQLDLVRQFLSYCPQLQVLHTYKDVFTSTDDQFLPNLIELKTVFIKDTNLEDIEVLVNKYRKKMHTIKLDMYQLRVDTMYLALGLVSRLETLFSLDLSIDCSSSHVNVDSFDNAIRQLLVKLNSVRRLRLCIHDQGFVVISKKFLTVFHYLPSQLEYIYLEIFFNKELDGNLDCFKNCTRVKRIQFFWKHMTDQFFANVKHFFSLPELSSMRINCTKCLTPLEPEFIDSMARMKCMKKFDLTCLATDTRGYDIREYWFGKSVGKHCRDVKPFQTGKGWAHRVLWSECGVM